MNSCETIASDQEIKNLPAIWMNHLSFAFDAEKGDFAIKDVSSAIHPNRITAIVGESGSGKSTLLRLIYGLLIPTEGEVRYKGWRVPTRNDKLIPGHDAMKLVSQGFDDLNTYAKVWDNVASQLSNTNLTLKFDKTTAILKKLKIDHLAQKRVADLSGGEKQRVAICRALINDPEVLLMDEPFNQVDASFRDNLQQDIQQIVQETGLTIILVSHDPTEVLALADDLLVMHQGKIIDQNTAKVLYNAPKSPYTAKLLAKSNILTATEASTLNITSQGSVAIHQEWIKIREKGIEAEIIALKFRGFYQELIIRTPDDITLNLIQPASETFTLGQYISIEIEKWYEFKS